MSTFQQVINALPAMAVEGDIASSNPVVSAICPTQDGGLIAGEEGVRIGRFAWVDLYGVVYNRWLFNGGDFSAGFIFVGRNNEAVKMNADGSTDLETMIIPPGKPVIGHVGGDFFIRPSSMNYPTTRIFADFETGEPICAVDTNPPKGADFMATINDQGAIITVSSVISGRLAPGQPFSYKGSPDGMYISEQISGTKGGVGVYRGSQIVSVKTDTEMSSIRGMPTLFFSRQYTREAKKVGIMSTYACSLPNWTLYQQSLDLIQKT